MVNLNLISRIDSILVNRVLAADPPKVSVGLNPDTVGNPTGMYNYEDYIHAIYMWAIQIGSVLTVLMIIYSGYIYMTSQGDSSKINTAKDIFMGTLLGFIILLAVGIILDYIGLPTFKI